MMKKFSIKQLSHAIIATMTVMSAATLQSHANTVEKRIGDLEIYEAPTGGGSSVMLMLDNSGSMVQAVWALIILVKDVQCSIYSV